MEIFSMVGSVLLNDNGVNERLEGIDRRANRTHKTFMGGIGTATKWGGAIVLAAGAAAVSLGGLATGAAVKFEKQMANVATLLDGDVKTKIGNMGEAVKRLSSDTGTSTELLTDGLYQVVSAFGETDDAMKILEISTKGASAGNATVTDSVNLLSAVTKGYGDTSAEAAQKTSDMAFLTVKLGQTTFPELASSMGKVIPLAGALTVKQEDLFGAMSTLTGVTGNTAEVSTQLRGVMQGLLKPSDNMSSALEEMGFKSGGAAIESLGLQGTLEGLKKTVKGNDTELLNMFGSVEAGGAVLALTGAQADNFTTKTKAMGEATGATENAFKTQQATVSAMMEKMKASFDVVMITLGEQLLPMFSKFLDWIILHMPEIQEFIDKAIKVASNVIQSLSDIIKDVLIPKFRKIIEVVQQIADTVFPNMGKGSVDLETKVKNLVTLGLNVLIGALTWIKDNMPIVKTGIAGVTAVWLIQKGVLITHNAIMAIHKAAQIINIALNGTQATTTGLATAALILHKAVVGGATAAQWLFNAAMTANPIGLVVVALATLGVGIALVVKHWKDIVTWIKKAWGWLKKWNGEPAKDKNTTITTTHIDKNKGTGQYGFNAKGTDNWRGGLSWVGEEGPELVNLPKGSQVIPNGKSMDMASSNTSKTPVTIQLVLQNGKAISEFLIDDINKLIGNENKVGSRGMGI